jgi:hypothetical protein
VWFNFAEGADMRKLLLVLVATAFAFVVFAFAENKHVSCDDEIVADKSFINLTTPSTTPATFTIYTPPADGTFRISIYAEMFGANDQTFWTSFVGWTDDVGAITITAPPLDPAVTCNIAAPFSRCQVTGVIHAKAHTPITLFEGGSFSPGGSVNAYVVLEHLRRK